jgi:hypothetical protein
VQTRSFLRLVRTDLFVYQASGERTAEQPAQTERMFRAGRL